MNIRYAVSHLTAPACPKCTHHAGSSMTRSWSRRSSTLATTINNSSKVGPSSCLASRQYSSRSVLPLASSSRGIRRVTSPWSIVHSHSESLRASPLSSPSSWQASRTFATPAQLPENTPIRVVPPTPDSLKTSEEFEDAELIPEKEATLVVTDDAIRVSVYGPHPVTCPIHMRADASFCANNVIVSNCQKLPQENRITRSSRSG